MNELVRARALIVGYSPMAERTRNAAVDWVESSKPGYFGGIGHGPCGLVAYVALPGNHPDYGRHYDELRAPVHGGLTYGMGNVFGWDYAHFDSTGTEDVEQDVIAALRYFYWRRLRVVRWWEATRMKLERYWWRLKYRLRRR